MSARDELARAIWETSRRDEGSISATGANIVADALLAAGYRKAEPVWEALENDGVYEYTHSSSCDGKTSYSWRRKPQLRFESGYYQWEAYEPEVSE